MSCSATKDTCQVSSSYSEEAVDIILDLYTCRAMTSSPTIYCCVTSVISIIFQQLKIQKYRTVGYCNYVPVSVMPLRWQWMLYLSRDFHQHRTVRPIAAT